MALAEKIPCPNTVASRLTQVGIPRPLLKAMNTRNPFFLPFLLASTLSGSAWAEPDANSEALAESLYREGKRLMAEGQAQDACPKFAESYRLSPATGTQLNLAACYQEAEKWASAWRAYQAAVAAAARDGRQDRVSYAQDKIAEIEPMLSYVTLTMVAEERPPGLEVSIDGAAVSSQALGIALPIDPGDHRIEAKAPGFETWSSELSVEEEKARLELAIPTLSALPTPDPVAPAETEAIAPEKAAPAVASTPEDAGVYRPIPTSVYIAGGLTAAAGAGALVTGILYFPQRSKAETAPSEGDETDHEKTAKSLSAANTGLLIATGVGAAATALLYLTRPAQKAPSSYATTTHTPWLLPWAGTHGGGLVFTAHGDLGSTSSWGVH